jgi:hypothetical protein
MQFSDQLQGLREDRNIKNGEIDRSAVAAHIKKKGRVQHLPVDITIALHRVLSAIVMSTPTT